MFLKLKSDEGTIKERVCADERKQRGWLSKEYISSPTVSTEGLMILCIIDTIEYQGLLGLFQLQMRISFPFVRAKKLRTSLLIMNTRTFYSPVRRRYIHKVSVYLVQKYFPYDCSTDNISCSEQKKEI